MEIEAGGVAGRGGLADAWALLSVAALAFSLVHTLVDWHIGLFEPSGPTLAAVPAALMWLVAGIYGWWAWCLARAAVGDRSHLMGVVVLTLGWAFAGNGLVIFACLPPCPGAFPHQDLAHMGSLVCGALGSYAGLRAAAMHPGPLVWRAAGLSAVLVAAGFALQAAATGLAG